MKHTSAILPGSFDPLTNGHVDIIRRAASLFDKLYIVVGDNVRKQTLFTAEERKNHILESVKDLNNVYVEIWKGLTVDFLKKYDCKIIIKGIRDASDFNYELDQAGTNKMIMPGHETFLMITDPRYHFVRSSTVKEMARFGADVSEIVPEVVNRALLEKFKLLT
ncbi:MAG: pantetheine-phosphate adenylyltransferase [Sphaerochaetaceae bacterium]|nr:pantetheine-phosphate adenylyltransferase [Sphaerochaetaceae bacterium]